ncbi:hypothetical protein MF406_00670 [Georgenia sp. TF02-10]|uniref:hypothetical protein n=1 Tax=Georgenia sp. TF02-10 TaxID=2917725 RepID=UPI001FA6D979|nr:hypothetical protein [Georgenia sp. TF02-10]UNX54851.1 hypothetical protein MF406_00670 [Georgenia sp. TF02-10]
MWPAHDVVVAPGDADGAESLSTAARPSTVGLPSARYHGRESQICDKAVSPAMVPVGHLLSSA